VYSTAMCSYSENKRNVDQTLTKSNATVGVEMKRFRKIKQDVSVSTRLIPYSPVTTERLEIF